MTYYYILLIAISILLMCGIVYFVKTKKRSEKIFIGLIALILLSLLCITLILTINFKENQESAYQFNEIFNDNVISVLSKNELKENKGIRHTSSMGNHYALNVKYFKNNINTAIDVCNFLQSGFNEGNTCWLFVEGNLIQVSDFKITEHGHYELKKNAIYLDNVAFYSPKTFSITDAKRLLADNERDAVKLLNKSLEQTEYSFITMYYYMNIYNNKDVNNLNIENPMLEVNANNTIINDYIKEFNKYVPKELQVHSVILNNKKILDLN